MIYKDWTINNGDLIFSMSQTFLPHIYSIDPKNNKQIPTCKNTIQTQ